MPNIRLGNESVIEETKKDPDAESSADNVYYKARKALGNRVTTMFLAETDIANRPNRAMNMQLATREWERHSDKPPAWVDGDDDLLVQLLADHYGCPIGQPKNWKEG
jgi:hypothetical protein